MAKINYKELENKWQKYWEENKINKTNEDFSNNKKKFYILDMFPYPSGDGLHVGHPKGYIATDVYSRMKKMQGYNVLHPMGWDAFGLPAEQYAIKNKMNPKIAVEKNINKYKEQLKMLAINYDWEREINTTDPKFYKWTQWMWKQMYKDGLAFESFEPINWCPNCKTGLANEDLDGNVCERCGTIVEKKKMRQWTIRITDYAERLLNDIEKLNWEPHIKELQKNWIGKSEGAEIDFKLIGKNIEDKFTIFTTRADTLFGCTYCAFAPENKLIQELLNKNIIENKKEVEKYISECKNKTEIERLSENKEKTGIELKGIKAINPANQKELPIYITDYVLENYGTGAIMAVPAHDERDYEFAKKYNIEINNIEIINTDEERKKIVEYVGGKMVIKYKIKDWVFARQRYWGEPFPIVFDIDENGNRKSFAVADKDLPIMLPDVENYEPTDNGESPLANIKDWVEVYGFINDEGEFESIKEIKNENDAKLKSLELNKEIKKYFRETNTMPSWAGSSWYYLRYIDVNNENIFVNKELEKKWNPVDFYVGGAEHATRHLIYARFWHKYLFDKGLVNYDEPFLKLQTVGLIIAEDGRKMSKRYGNVINPNDIINEYGCDTLRLYEMFMGPFEKTISWSTKNILGVYKFLEKVNNFSNTNFSENDSKEIEIIINQTIKKVSEDIENFKFNTAISQLMICLNNFEDEKKNSEKENRKINISRNTFEIFLKLLSPFAPHITEEIFQNVFENKYSIHISSWPIFNEEKIIDEEIEMSIQINGKFRESFKIKKDSEEEYVKDFIKNLNSYKKYVTEGSGENNIKKIIFVKNKLINIVI